MRACAILTPLLVTGLELRVDSGNAWKWDPTSPRLWSEWSDMLNQTFTRDEFPHAPALRWYAKKINGIHLRTERAQRQEKHIPRIIWQTAPSVCDPSATLLASRSWQSLNLAWSHRIANDLEVKEMLRQSEDFGPHHELASVLDALPLGVMRSDIWRYLVLYEYGGIYADLDTACLRPAESWVPPNCRLIVGSEARAMNESKRSDYFVQYVMGAEKKHPVIKRALDLVAARIVEDGGIDIARRGVTGFVHYYTGPSVWTKAIIDTISDDTTKQCTDAQCVFENRAAFPKLKEYGICLQGEPFFNSWNVEHKTGEPLMVFVKNRTRVTKQNDDVDFDVLSQAVRADVAGRMKSHQHPPKHRRYKYLSNRDRRASSFAADEDAPIATSTSTSKSTSESTSPYDDTACADIAQGSSKWQHLRWKLEGQYFPLKPKDRDASPPPETLAPSSSGPAAAGATPPVAPPAASGPVRAKQ